METKQYQIEAIDSLFTYFDLALKSSSHKTIVFQSPTGSGKTYMASQLLNRVVVEHPDDDFTFIWASIGKGELHSQSKGAVEKYLGGFPKCNLINEQFLANNKFLAQNEINFINWEKIVNKDANNQWINVLVADKEGRNLLDVLEETRKFNRKIILIVDESHIGEKGDSRIKEFRDTIIKPYITLEMSATPVLKEYDYYYKVQPKDVIDEGMIKNEIITNERLINLTKYSEMTSQEMVLTAAYNKREELKHLYEEEGSPVNPLVLIQIPNDSANNKAGEEKLIFIKDYLYNKYDVSEANGKLAVWLSGDSSFDKEGIKNIDNKIEYLVFKVSVATGWDCPRAQILVRFREVKSEPFNIQTLGRIMRTAEAKIYENDILNKAYIFTNLETITTRIDTYNPNLVKDVLAYRRDADLYSAHPMPKIKSYFKTREGLFNDATQEYYEYFEDEFCKYFEIDKSQAYVYHLEPENLEKIAKKGLILDADALEKLMSETHEKTQKILDKEVKIGGASFSAKSAKKDIENRFMTIIDENLSGLAKVRSESSIKMAIFDTFEKYLGIKPTKMGAETSQKIVVANKDIIAPLLEKSCQKFRHDKYVGKDGKTGIHYDYEIPPSKGYLSEHYSIIEDATKSVMDPLLMLKKGEDSYGDKVNKLERDFLRLLDESDEVLWYYVNGTGDVKSNFGIEYINEDGENKTFRPDFIVKFKHNVLGLFDTKPTGNERLTDTRCKYEGLRKYLPDCNFNKPYEFGVVIGSMVVKKGSEFYYFASNEEYKDITTDPDLFESFESLLIKIKSGMFDRK